LPTIITLTTDTHERPFGWRAQGFILKINPDVTIGHHARRHPFEFLDGRTGDWSPYSTFRRKTVHWSVVDPRGNERRPLLVSAQNQYFVAPDNGGCEFYRAEGSLFVRHANVSTITLQP